MVFQAYRVLYVCTSPRSVRVENDFIAKYRSFRVPCASCRSSFSAALEDVNKVRKMGFVAAVRPLTSANQL